MPENFRLVLNNKFGLLNETVEDFYKNFFRIDHYFIVSNQA